MSHSDEETALSKLKYIQNNNFIDTDDDKDQLYIIDGKEGSKEDVKSLSPEKIETIKVYKGDKAVEQYGKKAKDGVIEIKNKKEN